MEATNQHDTYAGRDDQSRNDHSISWEASEYIHHDKGFAWSFVVVLIGAACAAVAVWFQLWLFALLLIVMTITFVYYGLRKPQVIHYELNNSELVINEKPLLLSDFKSFGVIDDGALFTIRLIPAKRFAPATMIYFAEDDGEKIVDTLGAHMPMEHMDPDLFDIVMRKLRF